MSKIRVNPSHKQKARLIQETAGNCAFCDYSDAGLLQFHHIDNDRSNTLIENLIAVCPTCHAKITAAEITDTMVKKRKKEILNKPPTNIKKSDQANISIKASSIENSVMGNNNQITFNIKKHVVRKNKYSGDDIGADSIKANYISHLITRYHEYKEKEVGKENMRYGIFPASLKKEFKIGTTRTIYHLSTQRFEELVKLIQRRIDSTIFARQLGKGHKNYSSFEEYLDFQKTTF